MTLEEALEKIQVLEKKVAELEARPPEYHFHYHHHYVQPLYPTYPSYPQGPWWGPTYLGGGAAGVAGGTGKFMITNTAGAGGGGGH